MSSRRNILGVIERKSPYRFIPYWSFVDYLTEGLPQDHIDGKKSGLMLTKLAGHVVYAAVSTVFVASVICGTFRNDDNSSNKKEGLNYEYQLENEKLNLEERLETLRK